MQTLETRVVGELADLMDTFTGAVDRVVQAYAGRRNRERDIYWLALQTTKEYGAMVLHARHMMRKARDMEPLESIEKSGHDSLEEAEHYYGYRKILEWYLNGQPCSVPEWWGYGDSAEQGGAGPNLKHSLWPEHYGYLELAKWLAEQASTPWVRAVVASNREGAAVAFHYAMSKLPAADEYLKRVVQHERTVAEDELHHGPELLQELSRTIQSEQELAEAKQRVSELRVQELRQRNEQFMHPLTPAELRQLEENFLAKRIEPIALFSTGVV